MGATSYSFPPESGFYYLKSRYYDPAICRFINADGYASTGQGFLGCNMFAYCNNNPVNYIDESGKSNCAATWALSMPWLMAVDLMLPFGDIVYFCGLFACAVIDFIDYYGVDFLVNVFSNFPGVVEHYYEAAKQLMQSYGSTASNPPPDPFGDGYTSKNFRSNLQQLTGQDGLNMDAHHVLPQLFENYFSAAGININNPIYGSWVDQTIHRSFSLEYSLDWFYYIQSNPTPEAEAILNFARELAEKYGLSINF